MDELLRQILNELKEFKSETGERLDRIELKQNETGERLGRIESKQNDTDKKLDRIEIQQKENTQILQALEHRSKIHKTEMEKMVYDIAEMNGNIKEIKKDLTNVELITSSNWNDIAKLKSFNKF